MNAVQREQHPQQAKPQQMWLWSAVLCISLIWIFWDFFQRQFRFAIEKQADWGHTLLIPFIAGYFVWLCKGKLTQHPFRRSWFGLGLIVFGLAWYSLCALGPAAMHHHNLMGFGVAMTLTGVVLFIFGWRSMKYLWFPLLYLFVFGQTISDRIMEVATFRLQDIASIGSYYGLSFLGLDVTKAGNTLEIFYNGDSYPLNIAEACSGMRMLMAFFALGVAMAYTGLVFTWQRVVLVALAIPVAVFVNILRVMTLGLLSIADSGFAAGDFHTFVGTLWLIPAFLIYLGIVWILKNLVIQEEDEYEEEEKSNPAHFEGSSTRGFMIAVIILAMSAIVFQIGANTLNIYLKKEAVYPRKTFSVMPNTVSSWKRVAEDQRYDAAGVEALGTELYLSRVYGNEDNSVPPIQLHLAYYTGQVDAVPHVPDRCMVAGGFTAMTPEPVTYTLDIDQSDWILDDSALLDGAPYPAIFKWNNITEQNELIRLPFGNFELRTTEFSHPSLGSDRVYAGYFFVANGKTTAYPERIRMLAFDPSSKYAYYCKIQFTIRGDGAFSIEDFVSLVSAFTTDALPSIMTCLPDWAQVTNTIEELVQEN